MSLSDNYNMVLAHSNTIIGENNISIINEKCILLAYIFVMYRNLFLLYIGIRGKSLPIVDHLHNC